MTNPSSASSGTSNPKFNPWEGTDSPAESEGGEQPQSTTTAAPKAPVQEPVTQGQPAPAPQPAQPQPQGLTPEQMSELVAKTVAMVPQREAPQQQQQQFTEQDFVRTFNVFQPTAELMSRIGLPATPETVAVFQNEIVTPIVRQAVTMAAFQMEKLKTELMGHVDKTTQAYEPARRMAQERIQEQLKEEFLTANPDLKGYDPILMEIKDRLVSQGIKFKTKDELFTAVASHARNILKGIPGLNGQAANNGGSQQQPTSAASGASHMSALSGAGQGGAGLARTGAAGAKKKNTSEQLWG